MCGIAGAVRAGVSKDEVEGQLRLLEHRGPDASGLFGSGPGVIGQTRLSVIDLVTGDPPMTSEQGVVGAVLNGEIYNYPELRKGLLNAGHILASEGDTEVIAHLAEQSEPVGLARQLDGMFAFAVWDTSRNRLVLGRDRLGKKPLYYWSDGNIPSSCLASATGSDCSARWAITSVSPSLARMCPALRRPFRISW